jgi:flagellar FliL protein
MAEEENQEQSAQSKQSNALMIVLIALVLLLFAAVGVGGYFLYTKLSDNDDNATVEKKAVSDSGQTFSGSINDLVLNITNSRGREKLMKLSFSVKSSSEMIEAILEEYRAELVDTVIAQVSARTSEELLTVGGKELLKEELVQEMNSILNEATASNADIGKDIVKKIFFTTFVIK